MLSAWVAGALLSLWHAEDVRDWLGEAGLPAWTDQAAGLLIELADRTGAGAAHEQIEAVRAALYQNEATLPPPPPPNAAPPVQTHVAVHSRASVRAEAKAPQRDVAPRPRSVLLVGASSMQFAIGQAFELQLAAYEGLAVRRVAKVSTGLSRPDEFNWPARLEVLLDEHAPDLVIVNFGGNDAQNIPLPERRRAVFGTPDWDSVYAERVADFVTRIRARGAQAVMIGMPIMRSADFSKRMQRLNAVTEEATLRAGGIYLDQWDLAATESGAYRERVEDGSKSHPMRLSDGIHYSIAGGRYVVERLLRRLERNVRLTPKNATLGLVERHTFGSPALGARTSYLVWLPRLREDERVPLLVLLHGADSSPDDLAERLQTALATAAEAHHVAIVAPDGGANGFWLDSPTRPNHRLASFVAEDLLADARENLPVGDAIGVMGISMGGHGALTLAFAHPDRFQSASSISGVVDLTRAHDRPALVELLGPFDTQRPAWEARSALQQLERAPASVGLRALRLRLSCGAQDRWIEANRALHARATELQLDHDYDEAPAGHTWSYWQAIVPEHIGWHARALTHAR